MLIVLGTFPVSIEISLVDRFTRNKVARYFSPCVKLVGPLNADNIQGLPFQKACPGWLGHPGHDVFANGRTLNRLTIGQA